MTPKEKLGVIFHLFSWSLKIICHAEMLVVTCHTEDSIGNETAWFTTVWGKEKKDGKKRRLYLVFSTYSMIQVCLYNCLLVDLRLSVFLSFQSVSTVSVPTVSVLTLSSLCLSSHCPHCVCPPTVCPHTVSVLRDDDIEVLAEDGGKGAGETSPNRPLSRTPR